MRSGQQMYWLIILFSFPLLGSIVYFLDIYLPNSRLDHGACRVVAAAARSLDPTRELREARAAFDCTPTAQNQMRLASPLLDAGSADEAATNYEAWLWVDASGVDALTQLHRRLPRGGITLWLCEPEPETMVALERTGFAALIGAAHITGSLQAALAAAATPATAPA
ncbi:MAG: STAS domain-containing protein [Burkholderiaceae bacterium]